MLNQCSDSPQWLQQQSLAEHLSPPQDRSSRSRPILADPSVYFSQESRKHPRQTKPPLEGHLAGAWIYWTCCRWCPFSCVARRWWWQIWNCHTSCFQPPPILWLTSEALGYTNLFWNDHSIFRNYKSFIQNYNKDTISLFGNFHLPKGHKSYILRAFYQRALLNRWKFKFQNLKECLCLLVEIVAVLGLMVIET